MKRILITGGGGFLGGWILRALTKEGHEARIFDRSTDRRVLREIVGQRADKIEWVQGDVTDTAAVAEAARGCDSIIHLAALLTPACKADPILGAKVNLIGTLNVFEAAKGNGIPRVAYASSAAVFGPDDGARPDPVTLYGAFKLACEGSARAYWSDEGIASVGMRPTVVYGPGREIGLTAGPTIACREAVAGRPYTIGYSGPQDLVFVGDAAAAFAAAAIQPFDGVHAFSLTGRTADVPEIIEAIKAEVPAADIRFDGAPVPMAAEIAVTPYEDLLGPMPRTSLRDGIALTVAHYRALAEAA
ncbi:NAD-dependent epimerase/dehydratase family protein [Neorhizobium sp. DT-125]|uniref:NAD-dependent epimerase/dehydratase family protein n=1 Tax=Neorhizobium sp. DT-125 TaxID=3396163 RepID=UPI003F1B48A8